MLIVSELYSKLNESQPSIRKTCSEVGVALLAIAGLGVAALLAAGALFTVDRERIVMQDPSQALGNVQNLADFLRSIADIR